MTSVTTYILSQEIRRSIVVLEQSNVSRLEAQRSPAPQIGVVSAHSFRRRHANLRFAIVTAVDVQIHDIRSRSLVVDDLGSLHDAVRAQVPAGLPRQESILKSPLNEIGGRVAVDVLERGALSFVFSDHVVPASILDDACTVGLDVTARVRCCPRCSGYDL